jgi:hypothetical protein
MTPEERQALADKMTGLGYPDFETVPGEDDVLMLHVQGKLIGGALYALSLSDEQLKVLIDETVAGGLA